VKPKGAKNSIDSRPGHPDREEWVFFQAADVRRTLANNIFSTEEEKAQAIEDLEKLLTVWSS
jgi:hypothetical protein